MMKVYLMHQELFITLTRILFLQIMNGIILWHSEKNLTVSYNNNPALDFPNVMVTLRTILPDPKDLDYVLKRFSSCLNTTIKNTDLMIFIGTGAIGKSFL